MKRRLATIYAVLNTILLLAGLLLVFYFAYKQSTTTCVLALAGIVLSFIFAPISHELGHVIFAKTNDMQCIFVKCFCWKWYEENGKKKLRFTSPFSADQTQVIPKKSGNIQKRAMAYAKGGLIVEGLLLFALVCVAVLMTIFYIPPYVIWGIIPYFGYLFLLNAMPLEYASGKTDALVCKGIKKGYDSEKNMLAAMQIHGLLYEGKTFAEIDESYYFDQPQLCEDEPLFAVMLDLRYRYYLEKEQFEKAAHCLNRLAQAQAYLPDMEIEKIAAELTYMHALNGDYERAEESSKFCREYLQGDNASAKRILAAFSAYCGDKTTVKPLKEQGRLCLKNERMKGVAKFEEILLSRIKID